jgi:hypothetical protein
MVIKRLQIVVVTQGGGLVVNRALCIQRIQLTNLKNAFKSMRL